MAMVKRGVSFQNAIIETFDGKETTCTHCGKPLGNDILNARNGIVNCSKCGKPNKVKKMEGEQ